MPSSSLITCVARSVGVPQTAAVGCNEAASASAGAASTSSPVTSVAKCWTFARRKINGRSGTFKSVQCVASAAATDSTA